MPKFLESSTFASVWPHKKAVKKIEAEGVKEKQLLQMFDAAISPQVILKLGIVPQIELVFL